MLRVNIVVDWVVFLPIFTIGLVSSAHCIGMCGGIMGALMVAIPAEARHKRWQILVAYNVGRITSYAVMGFLLGIFVNLFSYWGGGSFLRILSGLLLIAMGLYLADWWRGLTQLERAGRYLWAYLQPLGKHLLPVDNVLKAALLGALWGWLPCGLVYSALALAIAQPSPWHAAGSMLAFGLGTLPAVLMAGFAAQQFTRLLQARNVRMGLAVLIVVYGVWTIIGSFGHAGHSGHSSGAHEEHSHSTMDHSVMHKDHETMQMNSESASQVADKSSQSSNSEQSAHEHDHHAN